MECGICDNKKAKAIFKCKKCGIKFCLKCGDKTKEICVLCQGKD